jgi:hypothetical protein
VDEEVEEGMVAVEVEAMTTTLADVAVAAVEEVGTVVDREVVEEEGAPDKVEVLTETTLAATRIPLRLKKPYLDNIDGNHTRTYVVCVCAFVCTNEEKEKRSWYVCDRGGGSRNWV